MECVCVSVFGPRFAITGMGKFRKINVSCELPVCLRVHCPGLQNDSACLAHSASPLQFTAAVQEFSRLYIQITLNDNIDKWMPNASHEDLGGDDDTTPCTICFEDMLFEDSNVKKLYPCGHMFHKVCIVAWYSRSMRTQCPYCRQRLKSPPHMTGHVTKARSRFLASASAAT
eukprot:TRINITY_DN29172_c0_g1_i1.p1 TRINITY_DN29172_c0_g1~~TRINITY_DN29172_c0_g1_i1.p1  ORF type:complete len:172 (+),score=23.54 TRINITY_DN29172_c0_g1_i1:14-529(+)